MVYLFGHKASASIPKSSTTFIALCCYKIQIIRSIKIDKGLTIFAFVYDPINKIID